MQPKICVAFVRIFWARYKQPKSSYPLKNCTNGTVGAREPGKEITIPWREKARKASLTQNAENKLPPWDQTVPPDGSLWCALYSRWQLCPWTQAVHSIPFCFHLRISNCLLPNEQSWMWPAGVHFPWFWMSPGEVGWAGSEGDLCFCVLT